MEPVARLIHKTNMSYLPTSLPVNFYGLPDGQVYIIYSRFYEVNYNRSGQEFVLAIQQEFFYDYATGKLYLDSGAQKEYPVFPEMVDKPHPSIKILKVYRNFRSYAEAERHLNSIASEMILSVMK